MGFFVAAPSEQHFHAKQSRCLEWNILPSEKETWNDSVFATLLLFQLDTERYNAIMFFLFQLAIEKCENPFMKKVKKCENANIQIFKMQKGKWEEINNYIKMQKHKSAKSQ